METLVLLGRLPSVPWSLIRKPCSLLIHLNALTEVYTIGSTVISAYVYLLRQSLMYYSPSKAGQLFFRITAASPQMISGIRGFIESGIWLRIPDGFGKLSGQQVALPETAYEANIPFVLRYMVDSDITGCCWIRGERVSSGVICTSLPGLFADPL